LSNIFCLQCLGSGDYAAINQLLRLKTFKALKGFLCADVPMRNYSHTHCAAEKISVLKFLFYFIWNVVLEVNVSGQSTLQNT